jgi:type I restriction enzyme, S subunit
MNDGRVKNEFIEIGKIPSGWKMVKLHELGEKHDSVVAGPFGSNLKVSDYRDEGIPIIRLRNIERNRFLDKDIKYISEEKAKELQYHSFKTGDLLLAKLGDPIGKTCLVPQNLRNGIVVSDVVRIRTSPEKALTQFIEFALNCDYCTEQLNKQTIGTTRPRVNLVDIRELMIALPPPTEQRKITSILSKVDNLIQKTEGIIEQTQRLKKALMQELLEKGIGHTKFKKVKWYYTKEIEIPESWQVVLLDDVAKRGTGHTPDAKKPEYYNGGIKWVSLADSNKLDNLYIAETSKEISEEGIRNSSAVKHPAGTVIMSRDAGVGKSAILQSEMAVSQHFIAWQCSEKLDNHFLYYTLQFRKPFFESIANGTTIKTIGLPLFKKLRIFLPLIEEQRKIAQIMINFEKQIDGHYHYLSLYNNLKKGLMQKLLTGKLRVKV